ncbi:MAG TPA: pseudouridine synthase [Tepidisphaeraceae bacterium]|nr:pseudouridine synthase [Tepidisphaeraceae bacterium]
MKLRIQKLLANAGVASRRNVEEMIRQRRVAVNGKIVVDLPILVDPAEDKIDVDGEHVKLAAQRGGPRIYILLNKPKHVYSTNVAQGEQTRAIDLLPPNLPGRVYPVGRLDAESKGLLLLTNDGELTHRLTHPRYGVAKTYRAVVDGFVEGRTIQALAKGMWLANPREGGGIKTGSSHVTIVNRSRSATILDITIREVRNQQIRQMLARLGHKVRDLTRVRMGPLTLHGLSPGQFRNLTAREIHQLQALARPRPLGNAPHPKDAGKN